MSRVVPGVLRGTLCEYEASLSPEDASLLDDAIKIFAPRVPVPDGSVTGFASNV